jgi:hypothetical protein
LRVMATQLKSTCGVLRLKGEIHSNDTPFTIVDNAAESSKSSSTLTPKAERRRTCRGDGAIVRIRGG